jgi:lysophospholipase L1-like esterase
MKRVVLVGDSIRISYQAYVARFLRGKAEVRGPEENGRTSENVLSHLDEWVLADGADVVHLNAGLHDLHRDPETGRPAVPLDAYRRNLETIFGRLRGETDAALIWAATTPVAGDRDADDGAYDRVHQDVADYNAAAAEVALAHGVRINDLFTVVDRAGRDRLLQADGVHFTDEGYEMLGRAVADAVRAAL